MTNKTVHITENSGLILEGGGMRGIFTNGVLDYFMDKGIAFPYIIGVSAGACMRFRICHISEDVPSTLISIC